jgi:hypothetical protein
MNCRFSRYTWALDRDDDRTWDFYLIDFLDGEGVIEMISFFSRRWLGVDLCHYYHEVCTVLCCAVDDW